MNDIGVIAIVPDRWHGLWMPRQQVLSRLARHFEVVWMEPPRSWRDYWLPGGRSESNDGTVSPEIPGFTHYVPGRWLPAVHRPQVLRSWLNRRRLAAANRILRRKGCKKVVLYIWRYEFGWAIDAGIDVDLTCYHIDDEYQFSVEERLNDPAEVALLETVDFVIVHSPKLMEKKGTVNPDTILVPNGVDFDAYSTESVEPEDLRDIPHPRVGYIGVVKTQLDFAVLLELTERRPEWSFVLVGPRGYLGDKATAVDRLTQKENVHMLGNRKMQDLPAYTQHMDVCLMCYEVNSYTDCIYPLKLHEYLATGRPVVSSPIQSVLSFANVVRLARTSDEWEEAISECLEPAFNTSQLVATRQGVARDHDWGILVNRIGEAFSERLLAKAHIAGGN